MARKRRNRIIRSINQYAHERIQFIEMNWWIRLHNTHKYNLSTIIGRFNIVFFSTYLFLSLFCCVRWLLYQFDSSNTFQLAYQWAATENKQTLEQGRTKKEDKRKMGDWASIKKYRKYMYTHTYHTQNRCEIVENAFQLACQRNRSYRLFV